MLLARPTQAHDDMAALVAHNTPLPLYYISCEQMQNQILLKVRGL
jgi:hypothetical protein